MNNKERLRFIREANYRIRGLKTWDTEDGGGCQGTVTIKGKSAFYFHDDGHGGEIQFSNKTDLYKKVETDALLLLDDADVEYNQRTGGTFAVETLVAAVIDYHEMKKACKKNTVVELSDDDYQYTVYETPYTKEFGNRLRREHGDRLIFILNEVI